MNNDLTDEERARLCGWCGTHQRRHNKEMNCPPTTPWDGRKIRPGKFSPWNSPVIAPVYINQFKIDDVSENHGACAVKSKSSCECGASSIGILDKQFGHSSWCPAKGA